MKKILLLAIAIVSFSAITSCGGDDEPSLQGKWEYFKEGAASDGQEILVDYEHQTGCSKDFIMISASSVADHTFFGSACEEDVFTAPYTRNGNTITVTLDGEVYPAEIKTLDGSTLKLYSTDPDFPQLAEVTVYKRAN